MLEPDTERSDAVRRRRTLLSNVAVAGVAFAVAILIAEFSIRWLSPKAERHLVLPANQVRTMQPLEEYVPGVTGQSRYLTSSLGIRGPEFNGNNDEYRILAIGGSTTQNGYLDQDETWTLLLGEKLGETATGAPTWTGDVGSSGHTARSHVLQFEYLIPELPEIDVVVMLVGVNDLTVALEQGMEYTPPLPLSDPEARRIQLMQAFIQVPGPIHQRQTGYQMEGVHPIKRMALYQLASRVKAVWLQSRGNLSLDEFGEIYGDWRMNRTQASRILDTLPELTQALEVYRGYLRAIADLADEYGVRLVLVTQPTLWRPDLTREEESVLWLGGVGGDFQNEPGHEYFSSRVLAEAMKAYKEVGYDGPMIDDHVPVMVGGGERQYHSHAFAMGYMRALVQAANAG